MHVGAVGRRDLARGRASRAHTSIDGLWYLPLFIPQACVLLGWQAGALVGGVDGAWGTLVWAHWVYALPYVLLVLAPAWRSLDVGTSGRHVCWVLRPGVH